MTLCLLGLINFICTDRDIKLLGFRETFEALEVTKALEALNVIELSELSVIFCSSMAKTFWGLMLLA